MLSCNPGLTSEVALSGLLGPRLTPLSLQGQDTSLECLVPTKTDWARGLLNLRVAPNTLGAASWQLGSFLLGWPIDFQLILPISFVLGVGERLNGT